jgi:hypothetical protein
MDVGEVHRMSELSIGARSGMRYQIDLAPTRLPDVPTFSADRNLMLEQRSWLGAAIQAPPRCHAFAFESSVDRPWTDGEQGRLCFRAHAHPFAEMRQP